MCRNGRIGTPFENSFSLFSWNSDNEYFLTCKDTCISWWLQMPSHVIVGPAIILYIIVLVYYTNSLVLGGLMGILMYEDVLA